MATYVFIRPGNDVVVRREGALPPVVMQWDAAAARPADDRGGGYARWIEDGSPSPGAYEGPPDPVRTLSQNQWIAIMEQRGHLDKWLGLMADPAVRARDRAYFFTGGDGGRYAESSSKLKRLASAIGVEVKTIFDANA